MAVWLNCWGIVPVKALWEMLMARMLMNMLSLVGSGPLNYTPSFRPAITSSSLKQVRILSPAPSEFVTLLCPVPIQV